MRLNREVIHSNLLILESHLVLVLKPLFINHTVVNLVIDLHYFLDSIDSTDGLLGAISFYVALLALLRSLMLVSCTLFPFWSNYIRHLSST